MRTVTLVVLGLQLAWSLVVLARFDPANSAMQLQESLPWVESLGLEYKLGVDGLSLPLVLINAALTLVSAICTRDIDKRPRVYFLLLLVISGSVNGAFLAENLLLFFLFYELELIPLWGLIAIWGGVNRAYAATKFLIFTAVSGMLILGAFLGLALLTGIADFSLTPITGERLAMGSQLLLLGALLIGFGIKVPLFPFHNWLPDAHTQASTPVSRGLGPFGPWPGDLGGGFGAVWFAGSDRPEGHETHGGLQLRRPHGLHPAGSSSGHAHSDPRGGVPDG